MRVAPTLHHIKPALPVKAKGHRIDDLRFRGNQLEPQVLAFQAKGSQCIIGGKGFPKRELGQNSQGQKNQTLHGNHSANHLVDPQRKKLLNGKV